MSGMKMVKVKYEIITRWMFLPFLQDNILVSAIFSQKLYMDARIIAIHGLFLALRKHFTISTKWDDQISIHFESWHQSLYCTGYETIAWNYYGKGLPQALLKKEEEEEVLTFCQILVFDQLDLTCIYKTSYLYSALKVLKPK